MSGLLSTSVWVRGRGGQEVRQERDHLYHVLCMTGGMRLNIYMCLRAMQIGGVEREEVGFVDKHCRCVSGGNEDEPGRGVGVRLGNWPNELTEKLWRRNIVSGLSAKFSVLSVSCLPVTFSIGTLKANSLLRSHLFVLPLEKVLIQLCHSDKFCLSKTFRMTSRIVF